MSHKFTNFLITRCAHENPNLIDLEETLPFDAAPELSMSNITLFHYQYAYIQASDLMIFVYFSL
jgi:hypothetical protein